MNKYQATNAIFTTKGIELGPELYTELLSKQA